MVKTIYSLADASFIVHLCLKVLLRQVSWWKGKVIILFHSVPETSAACRIRVLYRKYVICFWRAWVLSLMLVNDRHERLDKKSTKFKQERYHSTKLMIMLKYVRPAITSTHLRTCLELQEACHVLHFALWKCLSHAHLNFKRFFYLTITKKLLQEKTFTQVKTFILPKWKYSFVLWNTKKKNKLWPIVENWIKIIQ